MPGQDDAGKTSKYCTKAFAKRFCRWSDWRDRMRASPDRASCQTECCNGPGHDDRQPVGSPSRIETIENTRCEPAARPTRRPSLNQREVGFLDGSRGIKAGRRDDAVA